MLADLDLRLLQHLYLAGSATRAELQGALGLSQASVVRAVAGLRGRGLVTEKQHDGPARRGRPTDLLSIDPALGAIAGIEFGHNHLIIGFVAADGTPVGWKTFRHSPDFAAADQTMDALIVCLRQAAEQFSVPFERIFGVGLAVHGVVSNGADWLTYNVSESLYPVRDTLSRRLGRLVRVEDVSRAFAEAEHRFGAGRGATDMIYLFIGRDGIGSGLFVSDALLRSSLGICGEVGHITVNEDGVFCRCGNRGCLETVATHEAVLAQVRSRLDEGVISALSGRHLTFADLCEAYRNGDKLANIVLGEQAEHIAIGLASAVNIAGVTLVLIGGQLRQAGDHYLVHLTNRLRQRIVPALAQRLRVGYAELPSHSGAWGVAAQTLDAAWASGTFLETK